MATSTKAVRYFFASPPKNLDNDQPYVLFGFPLLTGIAAGAAVFVGSMYGLWTLAGHTGVLGSVDNMPLSEHASIWGKGAIDLLLRHKQPYAALVHEYMYELSLSSWWLIKGKALLSAVPSFLTMRWVTRKLCKRQVFEEQVGGMELVTGPKAHEEAVKAVDKLNGRTETDRHRWWRERGLPLSVKGLGRKGLLTIHPSLPDFCERALSRSMLILGSAGAGKTAMLAHAFYSAMRGKQFLVVLDVKGDLAYVFQKMAKRLKHGKNRVAVISMFSDDDYGWAIGEDHRYAADADQHAERWVLAGDGNPIWHQGGRLGFSVIELSLINEYTAAKKQHAERMTAWEARKAEALQAGTPFTETAPRPPVPWHAGHLAYRLSTYDLPKIVELAKAYDPIAAQVYKHYDTNSAVQSFETTFRVFAKPLVNIGNAWGDAPPGKPERKRISLMDFVKGMNDPDYKGPRVLILRSNERYKEMSRGYITAMHAFLTECVLALPDNPSDGTGRNLIVFLDEFAALGKGIKDSIEGALARGRSKGLKNIIATQTEAAMIELFGENGLKSLLGNLGLRIVGLAANNVDAAEIAATFGTKRMQVKRPGDDEPTFRDEPVLESNFLSSSDNMGPQGNEGVKALLPIGNKLFHLQWPFASEEKVPRAPTDKAPYELASWMTGGEVAPLTDYDPWRNEEPDEPSAEEPQEPAGPPPQSDDGVSGGPSIVVTTVGNPVKKGLSIDPHKAAALGAALAKNPITRSRRETVTLEQEAEKGSPEYEQAVLQAVEDQRAAAQRGDWIDQGDQDEAGGMMAEAIVHAAIEATAPGLSTALDVLKVAENLQAPAQNVETRLDSTGEWRTVTVEPPMVTREVQVTEKTPRQLQEEQDRERDRILKARPGVSFGPGLDQR
ncbi:TPA: type IV secretion system DNA-binding domain-containing protein [Burkholderia vietnamiensis]|nr:type IV secretion system DNA-binding domain-containing protein [Burkholderia vietnamiensis]